MTGLSAETRALLAREGLAPRKRLGQHFLIDRNVVTRMVDLAEVGPQDAVLEIGPGLGALTEVLAVRAARLYIVEYDRGLCDVLRRKFAADAEVRVIEGDALRVDLRGVVPETSVKVVASLPYNVSVPILFRLIEERLIFSDVTVMLQHEVAARLFAAPGSRAYGAPSLLFQLYARLCGRFRVPSAAFYPRPQVASEVIRMTLAPEPLVAVANPRLFQTIVRAAFNQRRKMLRNALQTITGSAAMPATAWNSVLEDAGIDGRVRGETLDIAAFAALSDVADRTRRALPASERKGRRDRAR